MVLNPCTKFTSLEECSDEKERLVQCDKKTSLIFLYEPKRDCDDDDQHKTKLSLTVQDHNHFDSEEFNLIPHRGHPLLLNRAIKWRCPPANNVKSTLKPYKLGRPIGVSFGDFGIYGHQPFIIHLMLKAYAACLMAFGEIYVTPESEWDRILLNRLMQEAHNHVNACLVQESKGRRTAKDTKEIKEIKDEKQISKNFVKCENIMKVEIYQPFIVGQLVSTNPTLPSLYYGISKFLRKFPHCLLTVAERYYLIWKNSGLYFLFDCYGRDPNLKSNKQSGLEALIGLPSIEDLNHVIVKLGDLKPEDVYILRRIKMVDLHPCCVFSNEINDRVRKREFEILNDYHSTLQGHFHLGSSCFKENRNKFGLAVAVTSLIYSKIDAPSTWDRYNIDAIIMLANEYYNAWTNCHHHLTMYFQDVPAEINMGAFEIKIKANPVLEKGIWRTESYFQVSELTSAIKKAFLKSPNLIVQISDRWYALWKRGDFYYLFDPYKHECREIKSKEKTATLHLVSTHKMLYCIFANKILHLPSPSSFYVHSMTITQIRRKNEKFKKRNKQICKDVDAESNLSEMKSLNESISDVRCQRNLECLAVKTGFELSESANLDSPNLSLAQIPHDYAQLKEESGSTEEEEGDEESEEESDESKSETEESEDGGKAKGKKKKKRGKAGKQKEKREKNDKNKQKDEDKSKGKKKEKKEKEKKEKENKEKEDKEKEKTEKERKEKEKKEKEKKEKENKEKEKKEKEKKGNEKKEKEKKEKEKLEKDKDKKKEKENEEKGKKKVEDKKKENKDKGKMQGKTKDDDNKDDKSKEEKRRKDFEIEEIEDEEISYPEACLPNSYPGFSCVAHNIAVIGSESGNYESLCNLIKLGFKCSDRILAMTPWGNYVVFKLKSSYFLYEGCTCKIDRFRHLDLTVGTAGMICFSSLHELVNYIIQGRRISVSQEKKKSLRYTIQEICDKYC